MRRWIPVLLVLSCLSWSCMHKSGTGVLANDEIAVTIAVSKTSNGFDFQTAPDPANIPVGYKVVFRIQNNTVADTINNCRVDNFHDGDNEPFENGANPSFKCSQPIGPGKSCDLRTPKTKRKNNPGNHEYQYDFHYTIVNTEYPQVSADGRIIIVE